ncbi:MAG: GIY-YIG nuclease family protein [Promethearchaeota archaeon]
MEEIENPTDLKRIINMEFGALEKEIKNLNYIENPLIPKIFDQLLSIINQLNLLYESIPKKAKCENCLYKNTFELYSKFKHDQIKKKRKQEKKEIYFIYSEHNLIKIGIATNSKIRLRELQRHSSYKLRILAIIPNQTHKNEKLLHKLFQKYRVFGEWFDVSPEIMKYIKKIKHPQNNMI